MIDALVNPMLHPDVYEKLGVIPARGLLLYGPPGTGKTMFGRAIANELDAEFISVTISEVRGKTPLQTSEMISDLFAKAGNCARGCVLFLDDCEELLSRPGNTKAFGVSKFLNEMDGLTGSEHRKHPVFVLVATNRPWMIDSALLRSGRIGAAVYVGLPDAETRRQIIVDALEDLPLAADVDIDRLVAMTEGFSGAELFHRSNGGGLCNEAGRFAARRWIRQRLESAQNGGNGADAEETVSWADFEQAFNTVIPVSKKNPEIIRRNLEFKTKYAPGGSGGQENQE